MPDPHTHLFEVEVRVVASGDSLELVMPSWTPGSYLLREFARHVQDFRAEADDGTALTWRKQDGSTWRIGTTAGREVRARYRVYANEPTVRTSHLDASHAYVNGASVFMFAQGREAESHELEVTAPGGWRVTTALPSADETAVNDAPEGAGDRPRFELDAPVVLRARDFDELVDSPIELGAHRLIEWEQAGVPHAYAVWGRGAVDEERLVADTRRIVDATRALFGGDLPYDRYLFILHLLPGGRGGLEHRASSSLQAGPDALRGGEPYESFLALVAHEFFHVWNAKRIRPDPLGPFDYTRENHTRNLWVVEGVTSYYQEVILRAAGLITAERFLERLALSISRLEVLPGRHHQSLEESSFDTWIRFYRPDEHTPNSQVSYYHKGALVALLLDLEIRRATGGERSLDDVMRVLWERFGREDRGFPEALRPGIQRVVEEVAGESLEAFFAAYVQGTEELDFSRALAVVGVELERGGGGEEGRDGEPGARQGEAAEAAVRESRLGIRAQEKDGRLRIANVLAGSSGYDAGLNAGDEVVAIDGAQVGAGQPVAPLLEGKGEVEVALLRRGELLRLQVPVGPEPPPPLRLTVAEEARGRAEEMLRSWLRLSGEDPLPGRPRQSARQLDRPSAAG